MGDLAPNPARPGDLLVVTGTGLSDRAFIALRPEVGPPFTLDGVRVAGGTSARAVVPHVPPGTYRVDVVVDGAVITASEPLTVLDPPSEAPCLDEWTMNTAVALTLGTVRIDRFDPSGVRKTDEIAIPDVTGVEYEVLALPDDTVCSVIWLRTADRRRTAFDVRRGERLEERATRLAADLGLPMTRTRMDDVVAADAGEP